MTDSHDSGPAARFDDWLRRLKRARLALAAAAIVFAGLWIGGMLDVWPALVALAAAFAVAAVMAAGDERGARRRDRPTRCRWRGSASR